MKIGIYTFIAANNFGAILQAYALQKYLQNQGHTVYCVDYRPEYLTQRYRPFSSFRLSGENIGVKIFKTIKELINMPLLIQKNRGFNQFRELYINFLPFNQTEEIEVNIIGSDQVWSKRTYKDSVFLGEFPRKEGSKLISYAASAETISADDLIYLQEKVPRFDEVSVREQSLKDLLQKSFCCQSTLVVDPTFLLDREEWGIFERKPKGVEEEYLLVYMYAVNENRSYIYEFAKKEGLRVVIIPASVKYKKDYFNGTTPQEFVYLMHHAKYVITDSFHGTAFSIIFGKHLVVLAQRGRTNERVLHLLECSGCSRGLNKTLANLAESDFVCMPAYTPEIKALIISSKKFLSKNISDNDKSVEKDL